MYKERAKQLKKSSTDVERILWNHLHARQLSGYKFRRQEAFGPYIVDFVCLSEQIVVELDGSQHMKQTDADALRTKWLEANGFTVLRFWDNQILNELDAVKQTILNALLK